MKLGCKLLLVCLIALHNFFSIGADVFPFSKYPMLSWAQFETDFRTRHRDIDIPQIILDNDCDFAPMYIWDKQDLDLKEFNKNKTVPHEPPFIIMNTKIIEEAGCATPDGCAAVLLHEVGHHNYGNQRRIENHSLGQRIGSCIKITGGILLAMLTAKGLYDIKCKGLSLRNGVAHLCSGVLWWFVKDVDTVIEDIVATRPEEYAADAFANQHATREELQEIQDCYSPQRHIEEFANFLSKDSNSVEDENLKKMFLELMQHGTFQGSSSFKNKCLGFLMRQIALTEHYLTALNLSHPSHQIRYEMVCKTLRDRFGII